MKRFILVVLDQLRYADSMKMTKTREILGVPTRYRIGYLPTVTESAHATISTRCVPNRHGVIGSQAYCSLAESRSFWIRGLDEYPYEASRRIPAIRILAARGVQCFVVAGKRKVASLMDPDGDGVATGIRVTLSRDSGQLSVDAKFRGSARVDLDSMARSGTAITEEELNSLLFFTADQLLSTRVPVASAFLFLGVPIIDSVGHRFSRDSCAFKEALMRLDSDLSKFIQRFSNEKTKFIVTADHGCRRVSTCLTLSADAARLEIWPATGASEDSMSYITLPIDAIALTEDGSPTVLFDGGTIRVWAASQDGRQRIAQFLRKELADYLRKVVIVTGSRGHRCSHENWGHVVGIAARNVALCRREWLFKNTAASTPTHEVVGEHGTDWSEDTVIPWWGTQASHDSVMKEVFEHLVPVS